MTPACQEALRRAMAKVATLENARLRAVTRAGEAEVPGDVAAERAAVGRAEATRERVVALYRSGMETPEIAQAVGWSRQRCLRAVKEAGVPLRGGAEARAQRRAKIEALAREGLCARQIGECVGMSAETVRTNCRAWGVRLARDVRRRGARS